MSSLLYDQLIAAARFRRLPILSRTLVVLFSPSAVDYWIFTPIPTPQIDEQTRWYRMAMGLSTSGSKDPIQVMNLSTSSSASKAAASSQTS
jgi:hypothetical protein